MTALIVSMIAAVLAAFCVAAALQPMMPQHENDWHSKYRMARAEAILWGFAGFFGLVAIIFGRVG